MAIKNITFNGYDLQTTDIITSQAPHMTATNRNLDLRPLGTSNSSRLVNVRQTSKEFVVTGTVTADTQSNMDSKVDEVKQNLLNPRDADLDIDHNNGTRTYEATCTGLEFSEEQFDITRMKFTATFVTSSAFGFDKQNPQTFTRGNVTADLDTNTFSFNGTAPPAPKITIKFNSTDSADTIILRNQSVAPTQDILISRSAGFQDGDTVVIDTQINEVTYEGRDFDFFNTIPEFVQGDNKIQVEVQSTSHDYDLTIESTPRYF